MNQIERERRRTIPENIICCFNTKSNEAIDTKIRQLRHCRHATYTFDDVDVCIDFLTDLEENEVGYLVIAQPIDEELLFLFNTIYRIKFIYVIGHNTSIIDEHRIRHCQKVKLLDNTLEKVCSQMEKDIRQKDNDLVTFQTFTRPTDVNKVVSNELNSSFMYSQLVKEMLIDPELEYDQDYIDTFIDVCRAETKENTSQLLNITSFQTNYRNHSAAWWYTKESFLYSTVNRALRTQDVTTLFMMAFFIRDLHLQLRELQQANCPNQSFDTLYRGQGMIEDELQRLRENVDGLLSFNNFLSTSLDYDVTLMFARSARDDPEHLGILFRMNINSKTDIESPYASLHGVSYYPEENEILFSMHTIFRIVGVREIEERLWMIELDLTNDKDEQLVELLAQLRSEIYVKGVFNVDKVGQLTLRMGDYDGALDVYQTLLQCFPDNQILMAYVYHHLGLVYQHKNDLEQAIVHYEKSIEIRRSLASETEVDRYLLIVYANLSTLYVNKGDLTRARQYGEHALAIYTQMYHGDNYDPIIHCYHLANLAFIQHAEGNFDDALANYQKVVEVRLKHLSPYHPDLAVTYSNLATVQTSKKSYQDSIQSLEHALEISRKALPNNHEFFTVLHSNLAIAFENCQKYDEASKHIQSAIEIAKLLKSFDKVKIQQWKNLSDEFRQNLDKII